MKTVIHTYCFDTSNKEEASQYKALCASLKEQGLNVFCTWGGSGKGHYHFVKAIDGQQIELETKNLFNNQWNTAQIDGFSEKGIRCFDWAEDYPIDFSACIKRGHYLEQTDEMREIRRNTGKCGYCGKQEPLAKGYVFCPHCLGSEYLRKADLHLLRLLPICDENKKRPELNESELAYLMPLYKEAQTKGNTARDKARIKKLRDDNEKDYRAKIQKAETEYNGVKWLLEHGLNRTMPIYYSHTNRFCFGWQKPLAAEIVSELLDIISEFPFAYDIKCADGKTLSGD